MADSLPSRALTVPPLQDTETSTGRRRASQQPKCPLALVEAPGKELDALSIANLRKFFELLDDWERESGRQMGESQDVKREPG